MKFELTTNKTTTKIANTVVVGMSRADKIMAAQTMANKANGLSGTVAQKQSLHTKDAGEDHPFDYKLTNGVYVNMAFVTGVIDKIVDYIWGPGFYTKCDDKRAKKLCDDWLDDVNFQYHGRNWVRQALIKGFSPLELGGEETQVPQGIKVLNADRVYVKRDQKGVVVQYNQVKPGAKMATKDQLIPFLPYQIAPLNFNMIDDMAYGYGIIFPQLTTINNLCAAESDMHKVLMRKANSPMIVTMGDKTTGDIPTQETVDDMADKLTYMTNKTEWTVPANVTVTALDFGNISDKFVGVLDHDKQMLIYGFQVPQVLMGDGNIAEGLAQEQGEAFDRYIKSKQVEIEMIIEDHIFRRILQSNGLDVHVEFEWGQPSQSEMNNKITQLTQLLTNIMLTPGLRDEMEKQLAELLGIPEQLIVAAQKERDAEMKQAQPIVPGQNNPKESYQQQFYEGELLERVA